MRWKGSRAALRRSIRLIPAVLSGRHADSLGLKPVFWNRVGNEVLNCIWTDFQVKRLGGTGLDGISWPALAESTLERRRRSGRTDEEILIETTALLVSLAAGIADVPSGSPGQVFRLEPDGITVGSAIPYAEFHQAGIPGRMPARHIVPSDGSIPAGWEPLVETAMEAAMQKCVEIVISAGGIP